MQSGRSGKDRQEQTCCPICDADHGQFWAKEYKGNVIVKCIKCGMRYCNPRLTTESNYEKYGEDYFNLDKIKTHDVISFKNSLFRELKSIEMIRKYLNVENPLVLDIGAGFGVFLGVMKIMGYDRLYATDLQSVNSERFNSLGITLFAGEIQDLDLGMYDVITCYHVLEHVLNPNEFITNIKNHLTDDGILHMILPNEGGFTSQIKSAMSRLKLKGKPFKHLSPGHHLYFYEPATLKKILEKHGFHIVYLKSRGDNPAGNLVMSLYLKLLDLFDGNKWLEVVARRAPVQAPH